MNKETINPEDIEVNDPITIGVTEAEYREIQNTLFKDSLNDILGRESNPKMELSEYQLKSAKVIIKQAVGDTQLLHLIHFAESWNMSFLLGRSGTGLVINFTLRTN